MLILGNMRKSSASSSSNSQDRTLANGGSLAFRRAYVWSAIGNGATTQGVFFLLAGLAVLRAEDPLAVGMQLAAQSLPALALLILVRSATSRFNFRSALVVSLWLQAASAVAFGVASMIFGYQLLGALIMSVIYATASTVQAPGRRTVMADLYSEDERRRAMSRITAYSNGARLVAPAAAGLALATGYWQAWFILDAFICVTAAVLSSKAIRILNNAQTENQGNENDSRQVLSFKTRSVRAFLISFMVVCVFGFNIQVIAPLAARDLLKGAEEYAGLIVSSHTLGSLLGAVLVARADRYLRACYAGGSTLLGLGLIAFLIPNNAMETTILVCSLVAGVGRGLTLTASSTMSSTWGTSTVFRERLIALTSIIFTASNLASAGIITVTLALGGSSMTLWVCGAGSVAAGLCALMMSSKWDSEKMA